MIPERIGKKTLSSNACNLVRIQKNVPVPDHEGGFNDSWENRSFTDEWAEINPIQARQRDIYKSIDVEATHLVKLSGYTEIDEFDRIKFGSRIFEVLTVENIQEADFLKVITCKEIRKGAQ